MTISIDPRETFEIAQQEEGDLSGQLRTPGAGLAFPDRSRRQRARGWRSRSDSTIATTSGTSSTRTPAAIMILTPEGKMARYLYGIRYQSARSALRAGRSVGKPQHDDDRKDSAVLLSLRSARPNAYVLFAIELHARRRSSDGLADCDVFLLADVPRGAAERAATARTQGRDCIMEWLRTLDVAAAGLGVRQAKSTSSTCPCSG